MNFQESVRTCFNKYATFAGRATRSEYWWFQLFYFMTAVLLGIVSSKLPALNIVLLAFVIPGISVLVRRLHDINRSGWWYWIALIPLVGIIILIYWLVQPGTQGSNDFGT
jgi:uncharacterized membrane protein YhaH (DUF805 family)